MRDFINLIPNAYKKWYFFMLAGILLEQLVDIIRNLVLGANEPHILNLPKNDFALGGFLAGVFFWALGGLVVYWWYVVRDKK